MTAVLAPALGRLARPPRDEPFEAIRLDLVDALVAADAGGRLDGSAWVAAWTTAITAVRDDVVAEAQGALQRAATRSRYPARRLAPLLPDAAAAESLLQRLLAEGAPLEALETAPESDETTRRRGGALEAAWETASRLARAESARYARVAGGVLAWRRPWGPLVALGVALVAVAGVLAGMIGGLLPAPEWMRPLVAWFWGLPWP